MVSLANKGLRLTVIGNKTNKEKRPLADLKEKEIKIKDGIS